jgi:uncharacterized membrane protein YoaK (UPF0700 family)
VSRSVVGYKPPSVPDGIERIERRLTRLLLLLTFGTGVVDAASYLGLHRVFAANMTGNVIFLGLGLAGQDGIPILRSLLALAGFMAGAAAAGHFQRFGTQPSRGNRRIVVSLAGVTVGLAVLTASVGVIGSLGDAGLAALTVVLSVSMGAQAAAARALAVADVPTVVVTSTLASLAAEPWYGPQRSPRSARRFVAAVAMVSGALVGAMLLTVQLWVPMLLATAIALVVTVGVAIVRWHVLSLES